MEALMDINVSLATRDLRPSRRDVVMSQDLRPLERGCFFGGSCLRGTKNGSIFASIKISDTI